MRKWTVEVTEEAKADLLNLLKKRVLSNADVKVLLKWVYEMEEFGPIHIAQSCEWHDHELFREWNGFRSSAFSNKGRVIYKIHENKILIEVYKVTTDHNYKK